MTAGAIADSILKFHRMISILRAPWRPTVDRVPETAAAKVPGQACVIVNMVELGADVSRQTSYFRKSEFFFGGRRRSGSRTREKKANRGRTQEDGGRKRREKPPGRS
jgi:hypothetical protein